MYNRLVKIAYKSNINIDPIDLSLEMLGYVERKKVLYANLPYTPDGELDEQKIIDELNSLEISLNEQNDE